MVIRIAAVGDVHLDEDVVGRYRPALEELAGVRRRAAAGRGPDPARHRGRGALRGARSSVGGRAGGRGAGQPRPPV